MDYRTAHLRRLRASKRLHKRLAFAALVGVLACASALVLVRQPTLQPAAPSLSVDSAPAGPVAAAAALPAPAAHTPAPARKVYPFSIVPGGVANRAELVHVLKVDKVVAAHYAAFQVDKAGPVRVSKPRAVYVSYRKGDKVYWTANKVALRAGETLLSDGSSEIRTRCGNRISDVPQLPVAAEEPSEQLLDTAMEQDPDEDGSTQPAGVPGDVNTGAATASAYALTSFPNGAGLATSNARTAAALGMLGLSQAGNGGLAPMRAADALPVLMANAQPAQTGGSGAGTASGTATQSGSVGGDSSASSLPGQPEAATPLDSGAPGGGADTPTGMSTPVLGSNTDTGGGSAPQLPPVKDAMSPQPPTLSPIAQTPSKTGADVPEPGSPWLCGAALAAMLVVRRRARRG